MIVTLNAAAALPVTLADAVAHCRAPEDGADSAAVEGALRAAVEYVSAASGRTLAPATLQQQFERWPGCGGVILLGAAPVRDVAAVTYLDEHDVEQDVSSAEWSWARTPSGAAVRFGQDWSAPSLSRQPWPVRVTFEAGYDEPGATGSGDDPVLALPYRLRAAILLLTGHWYEMREAVTPGDAKPVPIGVEALIGQTRIYR